MLRNFTSEISGKVAGKAWPDQFLARYNIKLFLKWAIGMDKKRNKANSAFKYSLYFKLLRRKIDKYNIEP